MKMMKRLLLLLVLVVVCCTLAACQKKSEPAANTNSQRTVSAGNPDDVMITLGTEIVTRGEYETYLATLSSYYTGYGYDVSGPDTLAMLKKYALQTGLEYAVMNLKVSELGLEMTEEEKADAIADAKAQWDAVVADGMAYYGITEESTEEERAATLVSVLAELESKGYTEEGYQADALVYGAYDKVYDQVTKDVTVTDEDVVEYYNSLVETDKAIYENDAAAYEQTMYTNELYAMYGMTEYITGIYYKPDGYRLVTHILLAADEELLAAYAELQAAYEEQQNTLEEGGEVTETLITAEEVENARLAILADVQPKVDEINQKLADGATFAELILEYTTDPGMADEASIAAGYEVHMDSINWTIPFRDQSFTVDNIGDVTEPVVTDYGVHIIQYVADVPGGAMELSDEMHAYFKEMLLAGAKDEVYYATLEQWMVEATPVYSAEAQTLLAEADAVLNADTAE